MGLHHGQHVLYFLVGAYHTKRVARKNAHVASWHGIGHAVALHIDHIHVVVLAQAGLGQRLAHKGATVAHAHVGQVKVAHQHVVLARAAVLTLVHVVEKALLHPVDALAQQRREHQDEQQAQGRGAHDRVERRERGLEIKERNPQGDQKTDDRHHPEGHIAYFSTLTHQLCTLLSLGARHDDAIQERRHQAKAAQGCQQAPPVPGYGLVDERHDDVAYREPQCNHHHGVDHKRDEVAPHHLVPQLPRLAHLAVGSVLAVALEQHAPLLGQVAGHPVVAGQCLLDEKRREKRGDDRHGHNDGIYVLAQHAQLGARSGEDKRELAYLREAEARLHGRLERLASDHHAKGAKGDHTHNHHHGEQQNDAGIVPHEHRVDHHAHRNEKHGPKEVFHRGDDALDALGLGCASQYRAYHKGTKGQRESRPHCQRGHAEAQSHGNDEQELVANEAPELLEQAGNDKDAHSEPNDEIERELEHGLKHLVALYPLVDGYRRENDQQHHGHEVLDDEHRHHPGHKAAVLEVEVGERLDDDGGRRHRYHAAQKYRIDGGIAQHAAHDKSHSHHAHHNNQAGEQGRAAHFHQFLEAELEAQREQEHHDAQLGPEADVGRIGHRGQKLEVRAGDEAGHDVTQHQGLLEQFKHDGSNSSQHQDECEVAYERLYQVGVHCAVKSWVRWSM